ncbi:hypothetical protein OGAPHI_006550 [Ogataea philodendri]|uniref:Inositol hexakisphosphate and diphosphoinositol-pentakisphosphate kinase n=1 Tax=Ogataea philodendri TaxID=1378263 RepID=A0A9P8T190_9ASCO|nr:uncharacterized protein OGAPHI_006550 [Ogataea philodendri]KAH3661700.1 hypothetical protein OGAPHI_006550 [Ogataea philodendri]
MIPAPEPIKNREFDSEDAVAGTERCYSSHSNASIDSLDAIQEETAQRKDPVPLTTQSLEQHKKAIATIAPMLEDFVPVLSKSEVLSPVNNTLSRTVSNISSLSIGNQVPPTTQNSPQHEHPVAISPGTPDAGGLAVFSDSRTASAAPSNGGSASSSAAHMSHKMRTSSISVSEVSGPKLPKIGTIGVCAMDNKVLSKPCRQILNRLIENGEFDTVIFGDKVILDESIENWPTCDFLISFFSSGFPLDKAIAYQKLRKPFVINDLIMQKVLWDRRLCLQILQAAQVPTPQRLVISRDGGPLVDDELRTKLEKLGVDCSEVPEPDWKMVDEDTLVVNGQTIKKPFVEKPVDGEDHNVYIYYAKENGGGGRRLFRKIGNKSSEFDPSLSNIRTEGSYIYEKFIDTDNFEDVKAYTVGPEFCHAETRKSPVVDGIVRRNTHGKEVRYVTELSEEERQVAKRVSSAFEQTICGFDLLRTNGKSYVIDVNGFSFVKDNDAYYDQCASILRQTFSKAKTERNKTAVASEEKKQKWVFKGMIAVVRHADRTPKQKFKYSFKSPIFISLLKGYKEEVIIREVRDLKIVLQTVRVAQEQHLEDQVKLKQLATALEKKMDFPGTKVQLKPSLNDEGEIEKVQLIIKWGGEPTHSARYQASDVGEQLRQDIQLLNKDALKDVRIYTSSERRVVASAQLFAKSFIAENDLPEDFLQVRKDLLDDSNAAKDLMDKVKKKLKPLLRQGKEAPPQFAWPPRMPEPFIVIKRVVELMNHHHQIMERNFETKQVESFQENWCCGEDPYLFKERWDKLFEEFVSVEKVHPSKISELYDTMKYDALHNRDFLQKIFVSDDVENLSQLSSSLVRQYPINVLAMNNFKVNDSSLDNSSASNSSNPAGSIGWVLSSSYKPSSRDDRNSPFDDPKYDLLRELYRLAKVLFDFICPQEYGIEDNEKLDIGLLTSLPLAKQIMSDISDIKETDKAATRVYFTKESHIYTLLNVIYESKLPMKIARNALPELDYLSQIVFELYESENSVGGKTHSIRLLLSPGCHTQDPLDVQLDEKHYISCIRRISLTRHLDMAYMQQKLKSRFSRVSLPKRFTPVNISMISSDTLGEDRRHVDDGEFLAFLRPGAADRIRVGDNNAIDVLALVESLKAVVGEDAVGSDNVALVGSAIHSEVLCRSDERGVLVDHVVDNDGRFVLDVSDQRDELFAGVELGLVLVVGVVVSKIRVVHNRRLLVRSSHSSVLYHMALDNARCLDVGADNHVFLLDLAVLGGVDRGRWLAVDHFSAREPVLCASSVGVDHGEVDLELVGQRSDSFGSSWVLRNNHGVAVVWDVLADPMGQRRTGVQVVHRLGKKPLHLRGMQVHGNNVVCAGHDKQIGQHTRGDGTTMFLHLGLLRIRKVRDNSSDLGSRTTFTSRNQNQQLHDMVVCLGGSRLDDVNVLVSHRNADLDAGLPVGKLLKGDRSSIDPQLFANKLSQLGVGISNKNLTLSHLLKKMTVWRDVVLTRNNGEY